MVAGRLLNLVPASPCPAHQIDRSTRRLADSRPVARQSVALARIWVGSMEGSLLVDSAAANLGATTAARRRRAAGRSGARFLSCPCSASSGMNDIALPSSARSNRHPGSHLLLVTPATVESRCTGDEGLGVLLLRLQDAEDGEAGVARERVEERRQWPRVGDGAGGELVRPGGPGGRVRRSRRRRPPPAVRHGRVRAVPGGVALLLEVGGASPQAERLLLFSSVRLPRRISSVWLCQVLMAVTSCFRARRGCG